MKSILIVVAMLVFVGCANTKLQVQAQTANAVATAANTALALLAKKYIDEGHRVIDEVKNSGGTREKAETELQRVRDRWAPIWKAWESLRIAEDAWATAIEQGGGGDVYLAELKNAYCELMRVWPEDVPAFPIAPLKCPPPSESEEEMVKEGGKP